MISVTILTKNVQETLAATLSSLQKFPEIIIYDSGSTDRTLDIARQYPNVKIFTGEFCGFGQTHNKASSYATHDWILSIDSDEVLPAELAEYILNTPLNPEHVYQINRRNYLNGKWIRWCGGWHPDLVIRLYQRQKTQFTNDAVHEKVILGNLQLTTLPHFLVHTPYRSMHDFLSKMQHYSSLFAEQYRGQKKSSLTKALLRGFFAFFKSYVLKRGFLGGKEGYIISLYNGHTTFYKYLKLSEANSHFTR